jgi:5'-methylthioadenosine phosphorylase
MRNSRTDVAIIGGSGLEGMLKSFKKVHVGTPFGLPPPIYVGDVGGKTVAFLPRHGIRHSVPPHKINYLANIFSLHKIGVKRIIATNAVGAMNPDFKPGDLVIPHNLIDFTKFRKVTFYNEEPVTHIDVSQPFCPEIRMLLTDLTGKYAERIWDRAVLVCTEGPRYETAAEITMFRRLGCDLAGMTVVPEAILARELEMCYATLCFVSNMAAGMQQRLTASEVTEMGKKKTPVIRQILLETIKRLPKNRDCICKQALKDARLTS